MLWDVFISHASEDKADVARPLQQQLERLGLRVWLDEAQLSLGDSLREKIDAGLAQSRFGIVILSRSFFAKRWPQRELNGLFARETSGPNAILPIWHGLSQREVAEVSPMLADRVAISTEVGLTEVARTIFKVAGAYLDTTSRELDGRYTSDFHFPTELLAHAVDAIEALSQSGAWPQLAVTNAAYPYGSWLGTDASALTEVLYRLAAPLVEFHQRKYALKRSLYTFSPLSRIRYALLEAALELFWHDFELAGMPPEVEYTPRVSGWREKRRQNPTRYWWQGIEPEVFEKAVPYFLEPEGDRLRDVTGFRDVYLALYASGSLKDQQPLGLLANALYGFMPGTRPVYWRLLVCWAQIYQALLGNTVFSGELMGRLDEVSQIFTPTDATRFPYSASGGDEGFHEPHGVTLEATSRFLDLFVVPGLRQYLALAREGNPIA